MMITFDNTHEKTIVKRMPRNERERPNAHRRHNPVEDDGRRASSVTFLNQQDLEYLSLNFRKERAANISSSKRRMVFLMF